MSNLELHENNIEAAFTILKKQIEINKELLEFCKQLTTGVEIRYLVKIQDLIEKQEQVKVLLKD
jgi:hypothetical protein